MDDFLKALALGSQVLSRQFVDFNKLESDGIKAALYYIRFKEKSKAENALSLYHDQNDKTLKAIRHLHDLYTSTQDNQEHIKATNIQLPYWLIDKKETANFIIDSYFLKDIRADLDEGKIHIIIEKCQAAIKDADAKKNAAMILLEVLVDNGLISKASAILPSVLLLFSHHVKALFLAMKIFFMNENYEDGLAIYEYIFSRKENDHAQENDISHITKAHIIAHSIKKNFLAKELYENKFCPETYSRKKAKEPKLAVFIDQTGIEEFYSLYHTILPHNQYFVYYFGNITSYDNDLKSGLSSRDFTNTTLKTQEKILINDGITHVFFSSDMDVAIPEHIIPIMPFQHDLILRALPIRKKANFLLPSFPYSTATWQNTINSKKEIKHVPYCQYAMALDAHHINDAKITMLKYISSILLKSHFFYLCF